MAYGAGEMLVLRRCGAAPALRCHDNVLLHEKEAEAVAGRTSLVVEAGTGTGKTFAYLIPALLAGARVLVSTGTRTLQDQLFGKDVPLSPVRCPR